RYLVAAAQIGVQSRSQHFCQHSHSSSTTMHPAHEAGMLVPYGERQNVAHEGFMHGAQVRRFLRHGLAKQRTDLLGNRLPDWPFANIPKIIEHVVQHSVALSSDA